MNKTLLFIVFASLAALGLAAYVIVLLFVPDAAAAFVGTLVSILAIVSGSATTFYMLGKQATVLEEVKTNTNGKLSEKDAQIADLQRQLLQVVSAAPTQSRE